MTATAAVPPAARAEEPVMTELFLDRLDMPTAVVGRANPLPPIQGDASLAKLADMAAATPEIRRNATYGRVTSICPYLLQDSYSRDRTVVAHPVAVLQNEHLRATFLLGQGGRLWSLQHRDTGRELLYTNPVFQPANLALRDAWLAGGVEWNIGTIGHTPLTCEPMHAARVVADDGEPVLRLYEFERLRRVVYQLDMHLPAGSQTLFVHVRITNPNDASVPMYWWSNIAVPQTPDTRVLAPAERTWNYSYDNVLRHEPVATAAGVDISYPARFADAADFFFDLDGVGTPWIAAVDGSGTGLFQTSSANLVGRKLFRWGTDAGGQRWQEWLTTSRDGYAEIQAGLARTQFEHLAMPAGGVWSWTEGYGRIVLDGDVARAAWPHARRAADAAVRAAVPADRLARMDARAATLADREPAELLHAGSGWGALERHLRALTDEPPVDRPGTPFDNTTLGAEQQPWLDLLQTGRYPDLAPDEFPDSTHLHPRLAELLAASPGWAAPALLGVTRAAGGDWGGAADAWQESLRRADNASAQRGLAVAALRDGRAAEAVEHYRHALEGSLGGPAAPPPEPGSATFVARRALVVEALATMLGADLADQAVATVDALPAMLREVGRIRLLHARAALAVGDLDTCGRILSDPGLEVADLREGEESLDALWWDYRTAALASQRGITLSAALRAEVEAGDAVPAHLDFRMKAGRPHRAGS